MSKTVMKDGRTWSVDSSGINSLKRKYTIILDTNNLGLDGEIQALSTYGIPAIGSVHPMYSQLSVVSYDVEEGEGSEKKLINVTTNYSNQLGASSSDDSPEIVESVEEWGWNVGTVQKEVMINLLTSQYASESGQLLNSAGDPFDTAPTCDFPAPVFTKVVKTTSRRDWLAYNCKINQNSITIGSMDCEPKTLLATISEDRIFGDRKWRYRYTVRLQYKTNMSMFGAGDEPIEFGWDIPVVDTGMRELDDKGKPKVIMQVDQESRLPTAVTSPELLDGSGHAVERVEGENVKPYIIRVQAYETETFPEEFWTEPA